MNLSKYKNIYKSRIMLDVARCHISYLINRIFKKKKKSFKIKKKKKKKISLSLI